MKGSLNEEEEIINYRLLDTNESYEKLTGIKKKRYFRENYFYKYSLKWKRV